ncbi:hypothetical protein CERSUDRAFT_94267 [Gelatoporia subvermispora B]|uniref:Heterokaryon incompatibility domain-containing protein n=1 Tax=Ceriporiopsis subvermispora (strain B) TaxID=914234 RepID=M2PLL4_CERS8|nr:hypothetical protein CERSUDRAFT_94267 [Gelatoporia subvermispora B]
MGDPEAHRTVDVTAENNVNPSNQHASRSTMEGEIALDGTSRSNHLAQGDPEDLRTDCRDCWRLSALLLATVTNVVVKIQAINPSLKRLRTVLNEAVVVVGSRTDLEVSSMYDVFEKELLTCISTKTCISLESQPTLDDTSIREQIQVLQLYRRELLDTLTKLREWKPLPTDILNAYPRVWARDRDASDFAHLSLASTSRSCTNALISHDIIWLGGKHDGYPLSSLQNYMQLRYGTHAELVALENTSAQEFAALFQSYLTFGLIQAVAAQEIPEDRLLRTNSNGHLVFSTHNLHSIFHEFRDRAEAVKQSNLDLYRMWYARAMNALGIVNSTLLHVTDEPTNCPFTRAGLDPDDVSRILFTIGAIGEALHKQCFQFETEVRPPRWFRTVSHSQPHVRDMIAAGWCPFTIAKLSPSKCLVGYASTCKPFVRDGLGEVGHVGCTEETCTLNTIDGATYRNRHTMESCSCTYSQPSLEHVTATLARGDIPIITIPDLRVDSSGSGTMDMICTSASVTPYVAISHVWADGLGSTTEQGLPTCQLRRLVSLTRKLVRGGTFWIDGLCVPGDKEYRKRAIRLMGRTYRDASVVLVIDSGIRTCSIHAPLEEKLLRIVTSGWMQRLWTLQESLLASTLVFEFTDGLVAIQDLIPYSPCDMTHPVRLCFYGDIFSLMKNVLRDETRRTRTALGLGEVAAALQYRTTSKPEDETLAISSLLDVDVSQLLAAPPDERMTTLFMMLRRLPFDIPFIRGAKLTKPGFRWAPRTLMGHGGQLMSVDESNCTAICTRDGLLATYGCISFNTKTFRGSDPPWALREDSGNRWFAVYSDIGESDQVTCNAILVRSLPLETASNGAAVMIDWDDHSHSQIGERGFSPPASTRAIAFVAY